METVSRRVSVALAHDALTERSASIVTVHATPVPVHAPPQPLKTLLASGVSSTVNVEPVSTTHEQLVLAGAEPQWMLPPFTFPLPA
jgi:hypothetical protein